MERRMWTLLVLVACFEEEQDPKETRPPLEMLAKAGFDVVEAGETEDGAQLFELTLQQPNDHHDPNSDTHPHHLTLIHRGYDRPMNVMSTGYQNYQGFNETAITYALEANQLALDKRFHNGQGTDWSLFTREQVALDAHRVIELLKDAYDEPWVSSGFSNGGVDVVNFRAHHPDDVAGTIALGSPFLEPDDARFLAFFDNVDQDCQYKLEAVQEMVLGNSRHLVEPLIEDLTAANGDTFARVDSGSALEAAVLSYPWLFWQFWGSEADCDALPDAYTASADVLAQELHSKANAFGVFPMSDAYLGFFGAFFFEVQQDFGWPAMPREDLERMGMIPPDLIDMERGLVPENVIPPEFDWDANDQLKDYALNGHDVIFTYAETDPWATGAVDLSLGTGSNQVYWITDGNHGSDIYDLSEADRELVFDQLEEWTGVTPREAPESAR